MNFFILRIILQILQLFRKLALLVKDQLEKRIIHSFGMVILLTNVENMVQDSVKNTLLQSVNVGYDGNERVTTLHLHTKKVTATVVSLYTLYILYNLYSDEQVKDTFYDKLNLIVSNFGDLNARVGSDHDSWAPFLGHFRFGKMNLNGQRLLGFCHKQNVCVTNSLLKTKPQHKVSWSHPRCKNWHQLDLILVRRHQIKDVLSTRSYQSADCNSDYSLVCCKMHISEKFMHK